MTTFSSVAIASRPPIHPRVEGYLKAIVQMPGEDRIELVSVILFGSATTGGFTVGVSDVDLILVLADAASQDYKHRLREKVERLEVLHGFRDESARSQGSLESCAQKITANVRSFFVCTRGDLLSGDIARLLDISPLQALFVDRVVIPSIMSSATTVWGEELLPQVPMPPIRRFDVLKAFLAFWNQVLMTAAMFPMVPSSTKYAMAALKRSVHNCYFCYRLRPAPLEEEVEFFQQHLGRSRTLAELISLRREYRRSFAFVLRCLPTLIRLHLRTVLDNRFPRESLKRD